MSAENTASGLDNSYTYDSDGLRLTKTVGDVQHKYVWQGSKLVSENWAGQELEFFYDESGSPYAFSYKASATATPVMYYYVTNLQGDVVNILDASGNIKASYTYNAWGEILSATGDMADINPLRYRGYYFDSDTGLYYLQSRYYDPELCRFINADSNVSTGQGFVGTNMFAYCANNPIVYYDDAGTFAVAIPLFAIGKILFDGCVSMMAVYVAWEIGTTISEGLEALRPAAPPAFDSTENLYTAGKRQNLPSYKKTKIDMNHIISGHSSGGNRGPNKDKFPAWMTTPMIKKAITEAYKVAKKLGRYSIHGTMELKMLDSYCRETGMACVYRCGTIIRKG